MSSIRDRPCVGIDFGTNYCVMATYRSGKVEIIPNEIGARTTPSYVSFTEDGISTGCFAKDQVKRNAANTVYDLKRIISSTYHDVSMQSEKLRWPFRVFPTEQNTAGIEITRHHTTTASTEHYSMDQILCLLLKSLKQNAETYIGESISNAVITVPANCTNAQREATKNAGLAAGFNVLRTLNDCSAAAITYAATCQHKSGRESTVLIFDLGASSLDVSLVNIDDGVLEVIATAGNENLGGEYFDAVLVDYMINEFKQQHHGTDISTDKRAIQKLRAQCEKAKRVLSMALSTWIEVDALFDGIDFETQIKRSKFEQLCLHYFQQCLQTVTKVLEDAETSKSEVDEVVLVGGSTRIPKIQQMLTEYFDGKTPCKSVNADEAVATGAAIMASLLSGNEMGELHLLLDVTPLSLGIETAGGVMTRLINRNKTVPCKATELFNARADSQHGVLIRVYEGEAECAKDNNLLQTLQIADIQPDPGHTRQIQVCFDMDHQHKLNVSARDAQTGAVYDTSQRCAAVSDYEGEMQIVVQKGDAQSQQARSAAENRWDASHVIGGICIVLILIGTLLVFIDGFVIKVF